jgi:drug/metabolite transporter (DMT)-like permease
MLRQVGLPLLTSALFAGSFIAGKYTTLELGPLMTTLLRYAIALVFLTLLVVIRQQSLRLAKTDILPMTLLGVFGVVGYHAFFFLSLRHTAIANSAIINAFSPVITGLLAAIAIHERLLIKNYVGCGVALIGVLVLLARGNLQNLLELQFNRGDLLMLAAVLSWAIYALIIKLLSARYSGLTISYYAALSGVVLLIGLTALEGYDQLQTLSIASIWAVIYMGIGASGTGYLLYNLSVGAIGPTKTATSVYSTVPIFVAILAFLFFGQPITGIMLGSVALIIVGVRLTLAPPAHYSHHPPQNTDEC